MNLVVLVGNLTQDPEVRYTQSGMAVANINIAVRRAFKKEGGPDTDFFRVTAFGKQAELVERFLSKGRKVGIEGRIQNDNYENKEGQKVYRDTIIANNIEFLDSKNSGGGGGTFGGGSFDSDAVPFGSPAPQQQAPQPSAGQPAPQPQQAAPPSGFSALEDDEDDLPF